LKGALGVECLSWELCEGKLEGGLLAGDPGGYVENALQEGISFHRALVLGVLVYWGFESWMKGFWE
jgi:hypothetical protein